MAKYGCNLEWDPKKFSDSHGVGIWISIIHQKAHFKQFTSFEVGLGEDIRFWDDSCVAILHSRWSFLISSCLPLMSAVSWSITLRTWGEGFGVLRSVEISMIGNVRNE